MKLPALVRKWRGVAAEALGSLVLVLVLYWLFMLFLYGMFPSGTPLKEIMETNLEPGGGRYRAERRPDATLATLFRDVRFRRGNSVAWGGAKQGMQLYSQDAVQTFDRSGAKISFDANDHLMIGSNSLVVVTCLKEENDEGPKAYRVKVDGELHGSFSSTRKMKMELEAAGHVARVGPGGARIRVTPSGRDTASFAVFSGEAQILADGGAIRVPANFGVALRKGVAVGPLVALPPAPVPAAMEREVFRYRLLPPKIRFTWSGGPGRYHFQLSDEPSFTSCLIDRRLDKASYESGVLEEGRYYWRVSRLDQDVEGPYSAAAHCDLLQVLKAPALTVQFPTGDGSSTYVVSGSADPSSRVFVDGTEVPVEADGRFRREVPLKPGVNLIRVEALDSAGNASYQSRIVYGGSERSVKPVQRDGRGTGGV